jgi:hypothetical protein
MTPSLPRPTTRRHRPSSPPFGLNLETGEREIAMMKWGLGAVLDAVGEISHTAHSPIRAKADVRVAAGGTPNQ